MENIEHTNYRIYFEIKGQSLWIPFGSYNDYTLLPKKELEDFIIYMLRRCIKAKAFMNDDEKVLFVKNIHLYNEKEKYAIYSIENTSVQIYP